MPINSPQSNNDYSELLTQISKLTLTGTGGVGFRYIRSAEISLNPDTETTILGSASDCLREIYLVNQSDVPVELFWFDGINSVKIPKPLERIDSVYQDWSDGGLELRAKSTTEANLTIWVRSNKLINYQVGSEEMIPVKVILYAPTLRDYLEEDTDPGSFGTNLNRLFGSSQNLDGHKLFAIAQSTAGKELNFSISTTLTPPIVFQWIDPFELALQGLKVAADILNPESEDLPANFVGRVTSAGSWMSQIDSLATPLKILPNRCHYVGRFLATSPITGKLDTAIITQYQRNEANPFDGGTVTLGGF